MSTPSAALVAALKGEFGKCYDGRKLRPATQTALVDLFAGRGESLVDVIQHVVLDIPSSQIVIRMRSMSLVRARCVRASSDKRRNDPL